LVVYETLKKFYEQLKSVRCICICVLKCKYGCVVAGYFIFFFVFGISTYDGWKCELYMVYFFYFHK